MTKKRLFLFGGYNPKNIIDDAVVFYVRELSKIGDVILFMDNSISDKEKSKVKDYTIFADGTSHGEYDFGSYKRCYNFASRNKILEKYDCIYFVNDSVYGPFSGIEEILHNFEQSKYDAYGMVYRKHKRNPHLQTWFFGIKKNVFLSAAFIEFINSVKRESLKTDVCIKYETGFTKLLINNNFSFNHSFIAKRHDIYNNPKKLFQDGLPFFKRAIINRYNGIFGKQINYILNKINPSIKSVIINTIDESYGKNYSNNFLTNNPIKILFRFIQYIKNKRR